MGLRTSMISLCYDFETFTLLFKLVFETEGQSEKTKFNLANKW